jgi:hypothetical protein
MRKAPVLLFDQTIPLTASLSGHRLVPGSEGALGLPVEAYLRLYAVSASGDVQQVHSLEEVLALVEEIRSEQEALQLLRLETAPETHFMFPTSHYVDVRPRTTLEQVGDVPARVLAAAGHLPPSSAADADGFTVIRDLVRVGSGDDCTLVRRHERISRDAVYSLVSETPLGGIDCSEMLLPDCE